MSDNKEQGPDLPVWNQIMNAFMKCAIIITAIAAAQFAWNTNLIAAKKRIARGRHPMLAWFPLIGLRVVGVQAYDGGHSCASIMALLAEYGIDRVLLDVEYYIEPVEYRGSTIHTMGVQDKSLVAGNQFDWADCLLRTANSVGGEGWNVIHGRGSKPIMRELPTPWGVRAKSRSFDSAINGALGAVLESLFPMLFRAECSIGTGQALDADGKEITRAQAEKAIDREKTKTKRRKPRAKKSAARKLWEAL